jgi:hypothetical protein
MFNPPSFQGQTLCQIVLLGVGVWILILDNLFNQQLNQSSRRLDPLVIQKSSVQVKGKGFRNRSLCEAMTSLETGKTS